MTTLLNGGLPHEIEGTAINPDFRNMLRVETIANDPALSPAEKLTQMLEQLYPKLPDDLEKAFEGLVWFFHRGNAPCEDNLPAKRQRKGYDFTQDASLIFSAFFATYGINLASVEHLHWWEFLALFEGLPEDVLIKKVMYWRTCDVSKLSKEEKKHVLELRSHFAIRRPETERRSLEQIEQGTHEYYNRRIERARERQK